jgi:hypothetical protein
LKEGKRRTWFSEQHLSTPSIRQKKWHNDARNRRREREGLGSVNSMFPHHPSHRSNGRMMPGIQAERERDGLGLHEYEVLTDNSEACPSWYPA